MAFNFPSGATNGQQYTADNGVVYVFDGTKWNIQSAINNYATTGSNTFSGSQNITGSLEVYSDNWPEIRLRNGSINQEYHIQNTAVGNLSIHNNQFSQSVFRIDSGSTQSDSHIHIFGDLFVQTGSIFSITGSHGYIRALNNISGNIEGIGNVSSYSQSVQNKINGLATTGSNTFSGSQIFTSSIFEIYRDNWVELRLTNGDTGISYHLQNTAGGNFSIHNDAIGASTFRIDSGSTQGDSHVHIFGDLNVQSGSIFSISGSHGYVRALSMVETPKIIGTGSITIQPDPNDNRNVQIYNTAPSDIHIKGDATYSFFGDDTNFLKIDNINSTITIDSTNGLFIDTPVDIKGNQIVSGSFSVLISGNAFGVNENPTPNNIFWSYIPNDTNTTSIEAGWIVNIETVGTYTVTDVEYDYPFVKITLDDVLLELPYRCNGYFSLETKELKFGTDGVLKISGSLDVSGSITGSTNFDTIVNKPTLVSGSSQLTESLDLRYTLSGSSVEINTSSLATTGSNNFVGDQVISGSLTISGSSKIDGTTQITNNLIVTGSSMFGSGSFNVLAPEKFLVIQDDPENYNIVVGEANTDNYSQIVVWNKNSGISASSDIIAQADNGLETNMYADLGINSSNFTGNGNGIGAANDAYVYGKAKDFWVGNLTTQSLYLFANEEGVPDAILSNGIFTFSGSVIANNGITGGLDYTNLTNLPLLVSSSHQIINLGFVTSSAYQNDSSSFDDRINNLISAGVPNGTISGSSQLTESLDTRYALIGAGGAIPSGVVSGSSQLTSSYDNRYMLSGSVSALPAGTISGSSQLTASFDTRYINTGGDGVISGSSQLTSSYDGRYILTASFNAFTASAQAVTTGSNSFNGTQTITGSLIITSGSFVGSNITANTSSLYLTSGSNMYVQNNGVVEITGSLIVSGTTRFASAGGDEGGEIEFGVPTTNTTLSTRVVGDIYQNRFRIFDGNTKGVFIDLSKAPTGVAGEITWKTSGLLSTGSFVSLDNIKAGPTRTGAGGGFAGLSIGAVSTSFVADVSAVYSNTTTGGMTITGTTYTTTAANSWNGWGFTQGQQSTYIVNDTTNSRVYRIILMIGASYNNNFTSIERLH